MATNSGKRARRQQTEQAQIPQFHVGNFKDIKALNYIQETYMNAIEDNDITFGIGSAGTGKTYIAAMYAARELYHRRIDKIILTRPNVEVGNSLGHLPGDLMEKFAPYLAPFEQTFIKALGKGFYDYCLKDKTIEPIPLGFMRGATFENCVVLADEMQDASAVEFKMFLSRIGKNCKVIISGDQDQVDIKDSGLMDAVMRTERIEGVEVVRFLDSDIVRSRICKQIIMAYRN